VRGKRGLFASIGAATSLILAGTLALASVSTVIAFRGWPGVHSAPPITSPAILASAPTAGKQTHHSRALTVPAAATAPSHAAASKSHSSGDARAASATQHASSPANVPSSPVVVSAAKPASASSSSTSAPAKPAKKKAHLGDTVTKVGDGLGNTVTKTGQALGNVVEPISPALGQVVTNATDAVGGIVKKISAVLLVVVACSAFEDWRAARRRAASVSAQAGVA